MCGWPRRHDLSVVWAGCYWVEESVQGCTSTRESVQVAREVQHKHNEAQGVHLRVYQQHARYINIVNECLLILLLS